MLDTFPDHRRRRSIAPFFFCHTLVSRPLFQWPRLADIGDTLFRSPSLLRLLGFHARPIEAGFYAGKGHKPFDVERISEFFIPATSEDFFAFQPRWLEAIRRAWPQVFAPGLWVMDSVYFSTPRGARGLPPGEYKVCILGVWQDGEVWPLLWRFAEALTSDLALGQEVMEGALRVLGRGVIRRLLLDRGFSDGAWLTKLWQEGLTVIIGVRSDMNIFADLQGLARLPDTPWQELPPPKTIASHHRDERSPPFTSCRVGWPAKLPCVVVGFATPIPITWHTRPW